MRPIDLPFKILRYGLRYFEFGDLRDIRREYCSFFTLPNVNVHLRPLSWPFSGIEIFLFLYLLDYPHNSCASHFPICKIVTDRTVPLSVLLRHI